MTAEIFANLATTTVSSGGTTAPSPGTVQNWTVASSASFPAASATAVPPTQFHVADTAAGAGTEIIAVTNVSGTTWTVTRGAEGTTPVAHIGGFTIRQVVTSAWLSSVPAENAASIQYVTTTGDTTGAADTTAIAAALAAVPSGGIVQLAAGLYYTNAPLIVPPGVTLQGATYTYLWPNEFGTPGGSLAVKSRILPVAAFSGDSVVKMIDQSTGGYAAASGNQVINNITIDGTNLTGGNTVNGFEWFGTVIGVTMNECSVSAVGGHGYATVTHVGAGIGYGDLDQLAATNCVAYACGGDGFHFIGLSDSVFVGCHSIGNTGNAWFSFLGNHNYFTDCKGEWSAIGWRIDVPSGNNTLARMGFEGCSTDFNVGDGWYFTGNQTGGVVSLTGCISHADGHGGGTATAGIHVSGAAYPILVTGSAVYTDFTSGGANAIGPAYGLNAGSTPTLLSVDSSYLQGLTAGWHTDNSGTVFAGAGVYTVTGGSGTVPTLPVLQTTTLGGLAVQNNATVGGTLAVTGFATDGNVVIPGGLPATFTGSAALTNVFAGPTLAANSVAAGQIWVLELWGTVTTTLAAQTLTWQVFYGGTGGTSLVTSGAAQPNAGGAVTGATMRYSATVEFLSTTVASVEAAVYMNFFLTTQGQANTTVSTTTSKQLVVGMTPSATAVSITINGGYWRRIN